MTWHGQYLKALAKDREISLTKLSELLGVSRQTVTDWIKGQIPKGHHLIQLSKVLEASPSYFFPEENHIPISIPLHRKRGVAKITKKTEQESLQLALHYEKLFREAPDPGLVRVLRIENRDDQNAVAMANQLRTLCGIESHKPIDYQHTFHLLSLLNIIPIFRYFPQGIKSYAFYCKIHKHRVVFVNNHTNVLDLIFPLLHEAIHATRDEEGNLKNDPEEEDFCDKVANYIQFPDEYVKLIADTISNRKASIQINRLKEFARDNSHSLFGMYEQLKEINPNIEKTVGRSIGGAATNLKKEFPNIGEVLFRDGDARDYIETFNLLSPLFIKLMINQLSHATTRKYSEWLGLESTLDGRQAIEEFKRMRESGNN
ncbi:helix-turn-helix domain-containing protein [Thermodesulfobacteriota bacterium]